jgi:hypothetical protein
VKVMTSGQRLGKVPEFIEKRPFEQYSTARSLAPALPHGVGLGLIVSVARRRSGRVCEEAARQSERFRWRFSGELWWRGRGGYTKVDCCSPVRGHNFDNDQSVIDTRMWQHHHHSAE